MTDTHPKRVIANWKMHGSADFARRLTGQLLEAAPRGRAVLCPPATLLEAVGKLVRGTGYELGGQDCHFEREGAFTGDISAPMLKDSGCGFVILGHSERRARHQETSELVARKAQTALATGLVPVICVGESLAEREAGRAAEIVAAQVRGSVPEAAAPGRIIIAYEPVWAIGTGRVAGPEDISHMHTQIRSELAQSRGWGVHEIKVVYGGSVKASNAADILVIPNVAGVLVGGASLVAEEFLRILDAAGSMNDERKG